MPSEKIIEIARRYTEPDVRDEPLYGVDGKPTGEFKLMAYWIFCDEELTNFAQSVIEADREELVKKIMPKLIELAFLSGRNNSPVSENEQDGILKELLKVWL